MVVLLGIIVRQMVDDAIDRLGMAAGSRDEDRSIGG